MPFRVNAQSILHLVAPLDLSLLGGADFGFVSAEVAADDSHFAYAFRAADAQDGAAPRVLRVVVEPRSARPHWVQTPSFNIYVEQPPGQASIPLFDRLVASPIVARLRAQDPAPEPVVWSRAVTLYLIAGVVGHPRDLGQRAVDILRDIPCILVEAGKEGITAELLAQHGIRAADKEIVPVPEGPPGAAVALFDQIMARDRDFCVFGADEGVPGFCDPGKEHLLRAEDYGDRIRVRTVGGVSALAMALMRIPLGLSEFRFTGATPEDPVETVCQQIHGGVDVPLMYFLTRDAESISRRMIAACLPLGAEVMLACNLTCEDEWFAWLRPDRPVPPLPQLTDNSRVVLLVRPNAPRRQAVPVYVPAG